MITRTSTNLQISAQNYFVEIYLFKYICVCLSVWICIPCVQRLAEAKEGVESPTAGFTGGCKMHDRN